MCNDNRIEDYHHLLFECKYYRLTRREFNDKLNQISNQNTYNRNMKVLLFKGYRLDIIDNKYRNDFDILMNEYIYQI